MATYERPKPDEGKHELNIFTQVSRKNIPAVLILVRIFYRLIMHESINTVYICLT